MAEPVAPTKVVRRVLLVLLGLAVAVGSGVAGALVGRLRARGTGPSRLVLPGTVQAEAVDVQASVAGRVRLVAVHAGDSVKAGQLVAWLEAPELRSAVEQAEEQVRQAQGELDALREGRPSGAQESYARAKAAAEAAERELESAQEQSRDVDLLEQRVGAARAAREQAAAALADAQARLADARAAAAAAGGGDSHPGSLESGQPGGTGAAGGEPEQPAGGGVTVRPGDDPAVADALAGVDAARQRKRDADAEFTTAGRAYRTAQAAARRITVLAEQAQRAAAAAEEARIALASASPGESGPAAEDQLRRQVREAQEAAAKARSRLREAVIVAPTAGLVERVLQPAGRELMAGQSVATIRRSDRSYAEVAVPKEDARSLSRDQAVEVRADSVPGVSWKGTVGEIVAKSFEGGGPVTVTVSIEGPGSRLTPGTAVRVRFL